MRKYMIRLSNASIKSKKKQSDKLIIHNYTKSAFALTHKKLPTNAV